MTEKILTVLSNRSYTAWFLIREMKENIDSIEDEKLSQLYDNLKKAWSEYDKRLCNIINKGS